MKLNINSSNSEIEHEIRNIAEFLPFNLGNALIHISNAVFHSDRVKDFEKAKLFLDKEIKRKRINK